MPNFVSQVPFIDETNLSLLRYGKIIEQSFSSGLFDKSTPEADIQSYIQNLYNTRQSEISNSASPLSKVIGKVYDGTSWSNSNPFSFTNTSKKDEKHYLWKDWIIQQNLMDVPYHYEVNDLYYHIWFLNGGIVHFCKIWLQSVPEIIIRGGYSQIQNDSDKTEFESYYKDRSVKAVPQVDEHGRAIVVHQPRAGSECIYATHNFCDRTTWFGESVRVNNETLSNTGDNLKFKSVHINWIDMVSGKVLDDIGLVEEQQHLNPEDPHGYKVIIKSDGKEMVAREPFATSGGDYIINFEDGSVTFLSEQKGIVTASYSYENGSAFTIRPTPGKILDIETAKALFSDNSIMNDTIKYEVFGNVEDFAPELVPSIPKGTKIVISETVYKRYVQILAESHGLHLPANANGYNKEDANLSMADFRYKSRGIRSNCVAIPFRYGTVRTLNSKMGMEIKIRLLNNMAFEGEVVVITLYAGSRTV